MQPTYTVQIQQRTYLLAVRILGAAISHNDHTRRIRHSRIRNLKLYFQYLHQDSKFQLKFVYNKHNVDLTNA